MAAEASFARSREWNPSSDGRIKSRYSTAVNTKVPVNQKVKRTLFRELFIGMSDRLTDVLQELNDLTGSACAETVTDENRCLAMTVQRSLQPVEKKNIPSPHENTPNAHTYWVLLSDLLRRSSRHNPKAIGTPKKRRMTGATNPTRRTRLGQCPSCLRWALWPPSSARKSRQKSARRLVRSFS